MKNLLRRARSGITSLETAVIIPVLLVVTLGAVDVARVIQAHQTIRDAAKVASRCIYPTDAACIAAAPSLTVTNQYQFELVSNNRETPRMDYAGTASWLSAPELLFNNFQARVLSDVRFDGQFSTNAYVVQSVPPPPSYVAVGTGNYFEMTRQGVPYVRFGAAPNYQPSYYSDPAGTVEMNPVYDSTSLIRIAGGTTNPGLSVGDWHVIWSSDVTTPSWSPRNVGAVKAANNVFTCVVSPAIAASQNDRISCREPGLTSSSPTSNPEASRIAIDVDGNTDSAGLSSFEIRVQSWEPGSGQFEDVDLHGREFNGPVANLLFPRGIAEERVINPGVLGTSGANVFNNSVIRIPWGHHFRVLVKASGLSPEVNITRFRIFAPQYTLRTVSGSCGCGGAQLTSNTPNASLQAAQCPTIYTSCGPNTAAPGVLGAGVAPLLYAGVTSMASTVVSTATATQLPPQYILPVNGGTNGCFATEQEAISMRAQTIAAAGLGNVPFQPGVFLASSQASCSGVNVQLTGVTASCPSNYGVAELVNPQSGRITGSAAAASQCPATTQNLISATNVSWGEMVVNVDHAAVNYTPASCSALAPNWNADPVLSNYPKLIAPTGNEVARHAVQSDHVDPAVMKASNEYSCGQFVVEARVFDDSEELRQSLFNGTHSNLGCDWQNVLRGEAEAGTNVPESLRLKSYEFFTATSTEKGWDQERTSEMTCAACTSCRFNTTRAPIPGLFDNVPGACAGLPAGTWCESRVYTVASAGQNGGVTVNETEASRIAFEEVKATIPSAKRDCTGTDCVDVAVVADTAAGTVNAAVSYQMPLYVLGNHSVTLSSNISEKFETKYSN